MDLANYHILLEKKKELDRYVRMLSKMRERNIRILICEEYIISPFLNIYPDAPTTEFNSQGILFKDIMIKYLEDKVSELKKFIETL